MTKNGLRGLAAGLFIAACILSYMYFFETASNEEPDQGNHMVELTPSEMIERLEEHGFVVLDQEQYDLLLHPVESHTDQEEPVYEATIVIEPGMTSVDIAQQLERAQIIDDDEAFILFLEEQEVSRSLKAGEFTLHSNMSYQEIVEIIS
ncbi:endolytic transglycosylase MltG [Bacillus alkalicellulosilyticus]|uniref:endolytic transglycosylase MltG n=1 Tax=Alkalihalobacterium alkalicellulosilyticum TaxID=1912214 RepID=UPI00099653DD|nr:endolytic transglycosylase MltG [Bacillus alkalicellulosilyticus]